MRIFVYSHRKDETEYFEKFSEKHNVEVKLCKQEPTIENVELARGFQCVSVVTTVINDELIEKFHQVGVKFISTRTIGYDHIDIKKAKQLGMRVGNVTYSPNSVTDYTIMLLLMATRKMKAIMDRSNVQDYSLKGIQGKEIQNLTVGVVGT
ncbi:MAG: lactate dehydrogenase, partial [Clostridiaceae bacterium]